MSVPIIIRMFFSHLSMYNKSLTSCYTLISKKCPPRKRKDIKSEEMADPFSKIREGLDMLRQIVKRIQSYGGFSIKMRHAQLNKKRMRGMIKGNKKK